MDANAFFGIWLYYFGLDLLIDFIFEHFYGLFIVIIAYVYCCTSNCKLKVITSNLAANSGLKFLMTVIVSR